MKDRKDRIDGVWRTFAKLLRVIFTLLNHSITAQQFTSSQALWCRLFTLEEHDTSPRGLFLVSQTNTANIQFAISLEKRKRVCFTQRNNLSVLAHRKLGNILLEYIEGF